MKIELCVPDKFSRQQAAEFYTYDEEPKSL